MDKQFYTMKEVAELVGSHYMTIYNHVQIGKLKSVKVGGKILISKENLDQYLRGE